MNGFIGAALMCWVYRSNKRRIPKTSQKFKVSGICDFPEEGLVCPIFSQSRKLLNNGLYQAYNPHGAKHQKSSYRQVYACIIHVANGLDQTKGIENSANNGKQYHHLF